MEPGTAWSSLTPLALAGWLPCQGTHLPSLPRGQAASPGLIYSGKASVSLPENKLTSLFQVSWWWGRASPSPLALSPTLLPSLSLLKPPAPEHPEVIRDSTCHGSGMHGGLEPARACSASDSSAQGDRGNSCRWSHQGHQGWQSSLGPQVRDGKGLENPVTCDFQEENFASGRDSLQNTQSNQS